MAEDETIILTDEEQRKALENDEENQDENTEEENSEKPKSASNVSRIGQ